jgi:phospholipid/cholesterol/gamma-HCH transport system substrate-binding protein
MEREANYVAVGAFVLLISVMAALFVYWYSDSREQRSYTRYEVYFDGSVTGLSVGGQVRYLGVDIGRVARIKLDRRAGDRVQVLVDIDSQAPISERTLAELSLQGVTGLLYIDLQQQRPGPQAERLMEPVPSEHYPVIRSIHSNFDLFLAGLPQLTSRAAELAARANRALSDGNLAAWDRMIANLDRAGATLPQTMRDAGSLVAELRSAAADSRALIAQLHEATRGAAPDLASAMHQLRSTADRLAEASSQLDSLLTENRAAIGGFVNQGLPQVEALSREVSAAARDFRDLSRSLKDNPSQLIYQPAPAGVEIPR